VTAAAGLGPARRPPRQCPVCAHPLAVTRLGCASCGTEISGQFSGSPYDGLTDAEHDLLRVFLVSRGNMKELERFLGVSYPTARQRFADLLVRLGFDTPAAPSRDEVLARLAAGEIDVDEAAGLLGER
jgi:hypothetical protein